MTEPHKSHTQTENSSENITNSSQSKYIQAYDAVRKNSEIVAKIMSGNFSNFVEKERNINKQENIFEAIEKFEEKREKFLEHLKSLKIGVNYDNSHLLDHPSWIDKEIVEEEEEENNNNKLRAFLVYEVENKKIPQFIINEKYQTENRELQEIIEEYEKLMNRSWLEINEFYHQDIPSFYNDDIYRNLIANKNIEMSKFLWIDKEWLKDYYAHASNNLIEIHFNDDEVDFMKNELGISFSKDDLEFFSNNLWLYGEIIFGNENLFDFKFSQIDFAKEMYEKTKMPYYLRKLLEKTGEIPDHLRLDYINELGISTIENYKNLLWELSNEEKDIIREKIKNDDTSSWLGNPYTGEFLNLLTINEITELHAHSNSDVHKKILETLSPQNKQEFFNFLITLDNYNYKDIKKLIKIAENFSLQIDLDTFTGEVDRNEILQIIKNKHLFLNFDFKKIISSQYSDIFEEYPEIVEKIFEISKDNESQIMKLLDFIKKEEQRKYEFSWFPISRYTEEEKQQRMMDAQNGINIEKIFTNPKIFEDNNYIQEKIEYFREKYPDLNFYDIDQILTYENDIENAMDFLDFLEKFWEKMNFIKYNISSLFEIDPKSRKIFIELLSNPDFQSLDNKKKEIFCIEFLGLLNHQDEVKKLIDILNSKNLWQSNYLGHLNNFNTIDEKIAKLQVENKIENEIKKLHRATKDDFILERIFQYIIENDIKKNQKNFEDFEPFIQDLHRKFEPEALIGASNNNPIWKYLNHEKPFQEALEEFTKSVQLFERLLDSPSTEVKKLAKNIFAEIIKLDNPVEFIEKIEKIFLENRLPKAGYLFRIFHELYDDKKIAYEIEKSKSPYLQRLYQGENTDFLHATFFKDLLKTHIYSGERSIKNFLTEMSESKKILKKYENQENLSEEEIGKLHDISLTLASLHQNKWVQIADAIEDSGNFKENFENIQQSLGVKNFREIFEYFEKNFLSKIGFENTESALDFMKNHQNEINTRNKNFAKNHVFSLQQGDMIKWFESNIYNFIANEGFVARDFLGTEGQSDATPFDIDLIRLAEDTDFADAINHHIAKDYGDAMAVFKKSENFVETNTENPIPTYKSHTFELFKTGVLSDDHFGIRTAVPTSEVSFYVLKNPHPLAREEFFFQIAKSGRYIPVVDTDQNLIFSYEDFEKFQEKIFSGISEWSEKNYKISEHKTENPEVLSKIIQEIPDDAEIANVKKSLENIFADIDKILAHYGIKKRKNGDKTKIGYEIQSTGSTSRNTFLSGTDATFDFDIDIKLDEKWFQKIEEIIADCREKFPSEKIEILHNSDGSIQLLHGEKDENGTKLEIDLLFSKFSENNTIDANKAIEKRLENILTIYGKEKYYNVLANIRAAKRWAKEIEVYKKWSYGQGGLGGIGIEVWILNHGGSFEQAKKNFLAAAFDADGNLKNFSDFRADYPIFGAGENIKSAGNVENFVNNMTPQGYEKFANALKEL